AQLSEFGDLGRSDGEVVIERAARELGAGDLAVHEGKSVLDLVLVDHPDPADLVQLGERDELEVADRCGAVGAYPRLGFEDSAQPVLTGRLGVGPGDGPVMEELHLAAHPSEV